MRVDIGDVRLFFDVDGESLEPAGPSFRRRPTLILLHGGPGFDHASFKPQFSALSHAAQLIYIDQRGHGRSDRSGPLHWTIDQWTDDVAAFCRALEIDRPVLYGVSFGGFVAQNVAIRHPDLAAGIILDSTGPHLDIELMIAAFEKRGGSQAARAAKEFWLGGQSDAAWDVYMSACYAHYNLTPQDPDAGARSIINKDVLRHFFSPEGEGMRFDLTARLGAVRAPVLVLAGSEDPVTPPPLSKKIVQALPASCGRYELLEGAGHGVFRDRKDAAFTLITEFLSSIN